MSSVASAGLAQIPRNSHFRPTPYALANRDTISASVLTFNPTSGVAPVLTVNNTAQGASGNFTQAPWAGGAGVVTMTTGNSFQALSSGLGLLKDMGDTIVSAGRTFRRVQLLDTAADSKNPGTYTGVDSDALCGYIEVGFRGVGTAGPFVRGF
jgi:hypothetical protein